MKRFSAPTQKLAPARATEEPSGPSVASTNPLKMDTALSAAAGPPRNPRGSYGPTGSTRGSGSKTRDLRAASALGEALGTRGTSTSERDLRRSDSTTLLGIASALGEELGSGTSTSNGNPRVSNGPLREETRARGSVSKKYRFPQSTLFSNSDPSRVLSA